MALLSSRLFWEDPYLRDFTASITHKLVYSNKPAVVLDQTAFYATNGGQPHDCGHISNVNVVDVIEDQHNIIHILERELDEPEGAVVNGTINWDRRLDHMQQHHGQHILSKTFIDVANASTLSFHLGRDVCYIDLDSRDLPEETLHTAMITANKIVYENLPVKISFHTLEEAKKLPLRKLDSAVVEPVRVVQVGDYDMQACCGTHPSSTGQVQAIVVVNYERIKRTTRVFFVCGLRATDLLYRQSLGIKRIGIKLTVPPGYEPVEKAVDQLMADFSALRKTCTENEKIIAKALAAEILQNGVEKSAGSQVKLFSMDLSERDINLIKCIAKLLQATPNSIVALYTKTGSKESITLNFIICASSDLNIDLRPLLKESFATFSGKGGGDQRFVQGNYPNVVDTNALIVYINKKLSEL